MTRGFNLDNMTYEQQNESLLSILCEKSPRRQPRLLYWQSEGMPPWHTAIGTVSGDLNFKIVNILPPGNLSVEFVSIGL